MNLPTSWQAAKIYQIIDDIVGGGTPSKTNPENFKGNIPFMTVKDMRGRLITDTIDKISEDALQNSAATLVPPDTLVIATRMALGKISKTTQATAINQDIKAIYPSNGVEKSYIEHFWRYRAQYIESIGTGTTVKGIRLEDIRSLSIPIAPSNEQRRIADKLDRVLARVGAANEHLSRVAPLIKRFRQSVLSSAMSGKLTEEWRQINNEFQEWKSTTLSKSAKFIDYRGKTPTKTQQGIPLITAKNVRQGFLSHEPREFINPSDYEKWMTRGLPEPGDVLITTEAPLGNVTLIDWDYKFALAQRLICLHFSKEILGKFAAFQLQSPNFQRALNTNATGSTVTGIQAARLKELEIIVPSLEEQSEIVRRVEKLFAFADRLEERLSQAQAAVQKLTPALLAKAFRGELVPQDPNDEPASELLKRLQESRTESAKPRRAHKPRARKAP